VVTPEALDAFVNGFGLGGVFALVLTTGGRFFVWHGGLRISF
jgi:hypothetical protein